MLLPVSYTHLDVYKRQQVMCANYFQAIGKIKISSVLNLLRQIIILIPCIIIFSSIIGLDGIFIAVPVADLSAFIITVLLRCV